MKKQTEYLGAGEIAKLPRIVGELGAKRVFLVKGKSSYVATVVAKHVEEINNVEWCNFDKPGSLPLEEDINKGISVYKEFNPDLVVAVGGGAVIDIAKAINHLTDKLPLIAIPTTSGSGSEATHFAVVYKNGVKHSLASEDILPDISIVDSDLSRSMPEEVALASGLDAMTQAIESWWARKATDESRGYARESLKLSWDNIVSAVGSRDEVAMEKMSIAAHLAGKAINISTTTACHALSYGLTYHWKIPHGIAVAMLLPAMYEFNGTADEMGVFGQISAVIGGDNVANAVVRIRDLLAKLGVKSPANYGVRDVDIPSLVREVNIERLSNNPRQLEESDIIALYRNAL